MPFAREIIQEFLVEAHDGLGRLNVELVTLEKGEAKAETLGSVFRTIHSLKGSAGFLGFSKLEAMTHAAEGLLSQLRDGKLSVSVAIVSELFATVDAVRDMLRTVELNGQDGEQSYFELIARLKALTSNAPVSAVPAAPVEKPPVAQPADFFHEHTVAFTIPQSMLLSEQSRGSKSQSDSHTGSDLMARSSDSGSEQPVANVATSKAADSTIRLSVERVDQMMNLVTELVLSRNQILQHPAVQTHPTLTVASRNLNQITSELQESVMRMRMQPISNLWGTLPRIVRDLSLGCGKQVRLVLEGASTELDKSVLEAIKDPLVHLVRNAIDHGIETPAVRQSSGKSPEGCLRLRAYHESGHVHIELADDGAGIDHTRVKAKACEQGLLTAEQADALSDESALSLIFLPGFSTKEFVSNLSGRGVGMDVVKSNVERIGGSVNIRSTVGVGTSFELRIPLTLAIIHALMVSSGGERYAVPQTSMIEVIRLEGDRMQSGIERIHGVRVHRYRGKLLPLIWLTQALEGSDESDRDSVNIIVLQAHQQQFGLIVDRVFDTHEIVVKPLNKLLRGISCLAGATILGDGEVTLILDVVGLAELALGEARKHSVGATEATREPAAAPQDMQQLVLVSGPQGERLAVPLSSVTRLEEFPAAKIEWTGSRPVMQYRDQILPLLDLLGMLERNANHRDSDRDIRPIHVVVCTDGTSDIGLIVGQILDIVTDPMSVRARSAREHVQFTAVVQGQVTEVLNVASLIASADAALFVTG